MKTILCCIFIVVFSFHYSSAQEIGTNDFQISFTGNAGDIDFEAKNTALAYNSTDNKYLAVWVANDVTPNSNLQQYEIWGQELDGTTANPIGAAFRISDMGPEDSDAYGANAPAIAYNSQDNEYLVVWYGDDNTGNAVRNEAEIWGQRINASTAQEVGQNDFRISTMGPNGNPLADGKFPAIAYNSQDNEYLVVWYGDVFFDEKLEVWGQRLAANGQEIGQNDFRISVMGGTSNIAYGGYDPAVTYNSVENEYLVVWYGGKPPLVEGENEIWGQRIATNGTFLGEAGFRISDIGKADSKNYAAKSPSVTFNQVENEYLVVWSGNEENYDKDDFRTWGQRLNGTNGAEIGENDFLISAYGPDRVLPSENHVVDVAFDALKNQYLVVWSADDYNGANTNGELEIFGKRLEGANGNTIENMEFRISDVGVDEDEDTDAERPYIVFNSQNQEYLIVWEADETNEEFEIYGQRIIFEIEPPTCEDGIQNGDEEGIDCGGTNCEACIIPPTCEDGIQNGDEEGIDCGGTNCEACIIPPTCEDGIQNGDEEGIDCGGTNCEACIIPPTCEDGIQNGDEEGIDCGGTNCEPCIIPPTCEDGIQNGDEEGIDCGGTNCEACICDPLITDENPLAQGTYDNYSSIHSSGKILANDTVEFAAENYILLEAGFHAAHESNFYAHLTPCLFDASKIEERSTAVETMETLLNIQPNPFSVSAQLSLKLEQDALVSIRIYNVNGKQIDLIKPQGRLKKGEHFFEYNPNESSKGLYFLVAQIDGKVISKRILVQ